MRKLFNIYRCPEPDDPPMTGKEGNEGGKSEGDKPKEVIKENKEDEKLD